MERLEYQMSNGSWRQDKDRDDLIEKAADYGHKSQQEIIDDLLAGKTVRLGTDWYSKLRIAPAPKPAREIPWDDDRKDYDEYEY